MSATIDQMQSAIKAALESITGLHPHATEPVTFNPPDAYPRLVSWTFDDDFDGGATYQFDVWVLVTLSKDISRSQTTLNPYLSATGTRSLKAALEADPTLGGVVDSARVTGGGNYGQTSIGDVTALGGSVRLEILA